MSEGRNTTGEFTGVPTGSLRPSGEMPRPIDPGVAAHQPPDAIPAPLPLPGYKDLEHLSPFTAEDIPPTPEEQAWDSPVVEPGSSSPVSTHIDTRTNSISHEITAVDVGRSVEAVTAALDAENDSIRKELASENGVPLNDVKKILPGVTPSIVRASEGIGPALQKSYASVANMLPESQRYVEGIEPVIPEISDIDAAVESAQGLIDNSGK